MDRILIEAGPGETRVALLDGAWLRELLIDRPGHGSVVGNVYLGRVERVLPGIAAAFVDIGIGRAGFLGLAEARPPDHGAGDPAALPADRITDYVTEGDAVLVQVQRDPAPDKGAKLTTHVALTGRRAVLMPGTREIRLSKRIDGDEERARLEEIVRGALGDGEGAILRKITLPLLKPTTVFLVVFSSIGFLRIFDQVYNMTTNDPGGPLGSTRPLVLLIYQTAFSSYDMGYAAAQTVVLFSVLLGVSLLQLWVLRERK